MKPTEPTEPTDSERYMLKNLDDYVPPEGWKPQRLVKKRLCLKTLSEDDV